MTPAELHTAHDALGVSGAFLAERCGVHVNMIWRYEDPARLSPVPDSIAETVRDLRNDLQCAVDRLAEELEGAEELPRYVALEDYWMAVPELRGWPLPSQGILLDAVTDIWEASGAPLPPIVYR